MNAIEVQDLRKTYAGGVEALRGVSFAVRAGEVFALLGPNGAGKSTTVRILATLSAPTAGRARVAGFDVVEKPREVRRRIGYVAQASGVDVTATGRENLTLQGQLFRLSGSELRGRVEELLHLFQLEAAADRPALTYSGGMRRRLDVAMGLIHRPEVLFLDEPTTGLDPESRSVMWKEVRRLAEGGLTLLLTTHYLEEADALADRIVLINQGRVIAEGTPAEIKARVVGRKIRCRTSLTLEEASAVPGVRNARREGEITELFTNEADRAVRELLQRDPGLSGLEVQGADLEEAFLALTGADSKEEVAA
jgi:ABC-2 type transport system ATP-binding protein